MEKIIVPVFHFWYKPLCHDAAFTQELCHPFTRGVTGFVGSATNAIPLTEDEVLALGMERREIVVAYNVGDQVKITDGPLATFLGTVEEIEPEKNRVCVVVSMFGRETPVELELDQVEVVER